MDASTSKPAGTSTSTTTGNSTFGPIRRVLTSHHSTDKDGSSVEIFDDLVPLAPVLDGNAFITPLFASLGLPSTSSHSITPQGISEAMSMAPSVVMPGGVNIRVTDVQPSFLIQMHRTNSIDYNIITHGSATLITPIVHEDGSTGETRTTVGPGELVVQRGTIHAWEAGPKGARWITVVVPAKAVEKDGEVLEEVDFQ